MTTAQAERLVKKLILAYPSGQRVEPETAAIYAALLSQFDHDEANAAVTKVCMTEQFFPTVAVVVDVIVAGRMAHLPEPMGAWELVMRWEGELRQWDRATEREERSLEDDEYARWIERGRPPLVPKPQEPPAAVTRALEIVGGISAIRLADNISVLRAHFRDAYAGVVREHEREVRSLLQIGTPARLELLPGGEVT